MWTLLYDRIIGISSTTLYDIATIKAAWYAMTEEEFQCEKTFEALSKRKDAEIVIEHERKKKGCGIITQEPKIVIDDVIAFHSCLCNKQFQHPNMGNLLFLHDNYKKGVMPFSGSLSDQPSQIIEIFKLLDYLYDEREQKVNKQQSKGK